MRELSEEKIFAQKVSDDELMAVEGGKTDKNGGCIDVFLRSIYTGSFPNCASTVVNGSRCTSADACSINAILYVDMKKCHRAWE